MKTFKKYLSISHPMLTSNFINSEAYKIIKTFIFQIDNSIKKETQYKIPDNFILFKISNIVENTPLSETKGRYANPGMVNVIEKIEEECKDDESKPENDEKMKYLINSFGNKTRMDFGTGHELNFLCFLYTNVKDGLIEINQVYDILNHYFDIVRLFIRKFNIEAAGSRGCWSIDDYLLLPYLFGSSERVKERTGNNRVSNDNMEIFYNNTSPVLMKMMNNSWKEVNNELIRTYDETVLQKNVVTQHFIYSKYLPE